MAELKLSCHCGKVRGVAHDVSPSVGNRLICYCESCQQFPIKLGKTDQVLDEYGGTDIYQLPPGQLKITEGIEEIRCLRHTSKGLYRFYAGCCDTPFANSPGPGMPFIGLLHAVDSEPEQRDAHIGGIRAHVNTEEATKPLPADRKYGLAMVIVRIVSQMIWWRVTGRAKPHPFFTDDGLPIVEPEVR